MHDTLQDLCPTCAPEELRHSIVERAARGYLRARIFRNLALVTIAVASTMQVIISCVMPVAGASSPQATSMWAGGVLISFLTSAAVWNARAHAENQAVAYDAYLSRTRPRLRDEETDG